MTWTRLDDGWTERADLAELPLATRWHYLALIQFCSRTGRLDGVVRLADARRCSDVDNPDDAHESLITAGLLERRDGGFALLEIYEHVPPKRSAERGDDQDQDASEPCAQGRRPPALSG